MLVVIVSLAFATVSFAGVPAFSIAQGPVTSLSTSELTVQANAQIPTSCTRASSSPVVAGFKVGDQVTINCVQGVLVSIAKGLSKPPLGPVIPIRGLPTVACRCADSGPESDGWPMRGRLECERSARRTRSDWGAEPARRLCRQRERKPVALRLMGQPVRSTLPSPACEQRG